MDDLDDHRAFLDGLPGLEELVPRPALDPGAAHLAAAFTELRASIEGLHADLAQRQKTMERKVTELERKVDSRAPDWRTVAEEVVVAGARGGASAAESVRRASQVLADQADQMLMGRVADIRAFRRVVYWVALPLFLAALGALLLAALAAGSLPPGWTLSAAFILGIAATCLGQNLKERWETWSERHGRRDC